MLAIINKLLLSNSAKFSHICCLETLFVINKIQNNVVNNSKLFNCQTRFFSQQNIKVIQKDISNLKKKAVRKKRVLTDTDVIEPGFWRVKALATAEEYSLESLTEALKKQDLYIANSIFTPDKSLQHSVVHATAKYEVQHEPREIYFFREGTIVMWNVSDLECANILHFLKDFEENKYPSYLVVPEIETLAYTYIEPGRQSHLQNGNIYLTPVNNYLDKYTFSNAISQSVKLGIWEASLSHYVDSIEFIIEDLKTGRKIKMSRQQVLRKQGELFALRHLINLSSDLLDTPDFYWERDELENLYHQTCSYFSISKRTRVMNEKVNHCMELVELISSHLSDRHHVRLEWMIIVLIMVEVAFETLHYINRFIDDENTKNYQQLPENNEKKYQN